MKSLRTGSTGVALAVVTIIWLACKGPTESESELVFARTFGGSGSDLGYSVQQTSDSGYIILGQTASFGAGKKDAWLIKADANGAEMWSRTFGGSEDDGGYAVLQTDDCGFIMAGYTMSFGAGETDIWLIKTDAEGKKVWSRTIGGSGIDLGFSVRQTMDGGYIIAGSTASTGKGKYDGWLVKTDPLGLEIWSSTFGGIANDFAQCVQQTADSGYVFTGSTYSSHAQGYDVWLVKTDAAGKKEWAQTFDRYDTDWGYSLVQWNDGGYLVVGKCENSDTNYSRLWLIRTTANGVEESSNTYGYSVGFSIQGSGAKGYCIVGTSRSKDTQGRDIGLIKLGPSGTSAWVRTFGGPGDDWGLCGQLTNDGAYVVVGYTGSYGKGGYDVWLVKTDQYGYTEF